MKEPAYAAARAVAERVEALFERHLSAARQRDQPDLAPPPDAAAIEAIVDAAFWASLRREEGHSPKISLAFLPPGRAGYPLRFENGLPLTASALSRLSPAVERPGIHLGVWRAEGNLQVWGATRTIPNYCFVLEVVAPGHLVIKYRREVGFGKFGNVLVLEGDQIKVVDEGSIRSAECPALMASFFQSDPLAAPQDGFNLFIQLAVSMRAHQHGGALLVIPDGTHSWRTSMVWPVPYAVAPPFAGLADAVEQNLDGEDGLSRQETLRQAVEAVAGLTAVDGATVISDTFKLLAFGAKIRRSPQAEPIEQIMVTEPVVGSMPSVLHPSRFGGTRHLSAAQFVHDQRDAVALVASQDGPFTIFAWSPAHAMVQAHRAEVLLL